MVSLDEYVNKYPSIKMERHNGILQMTFHTDNGPLQWGGSPVSYTHLTLPTICSV